MSITLFFGKLNLVTEDIFEIYDNPEKLKDLFTNLYLGVKSGLHYEKERSFLRDDGEIISQTIRYSMQVFSIDQSYVEGRIYKSSAIHYKILDKLSGELLPQSVENTEEIQFYLDIQHELVGYDTKQRFGYREFLEAFGEIINSGQAAIESPYRFKVELRTMGMNLEEIKESLHRIGRIKELTIKMQPPNPSNDLLAELQHRGDGFVKEMKQANATTIGFTFESEGSSGLNIDSPLINDRITDLQGLCSMLSVEEAIQKGYATVNAQSKSGVKYTTGEEKPYKRVIDSLEEFVSGCKDAFRQLLS